MAFTSIDSSLVRAGKSLIYTLMDLVRTNFDDHETRVSALESAVASFALPVGIVFKRATSALPSGYLACDGSAVSRATYSGLFALVGTRFGAGDGVSTFNLPDLRGRAVVGSGTGSYVGASTRNIADLVGEETHLLSLAELAAHTHAVTDPTHTHTFIASKAIAHGLGGIFGFRDILTIDGTPGSMTTGTTTMNLSTANTGGGLAHNNLQPALVCQFIIKVL